MHLGRQIKCHLTNAVMFLLLALHGTSAALAQTATDKTRFSVAYAQDNMANDWRAAQVRQFIEFFKAYPEIQFSYTNANGSTAKQIQDIEDLVHAKVDVLITSPRDSAAMTPVIRKVYQQGVPVVLVTRNIQTDDYTSFIAPDDKKIAQQAARYLARRLKGKGRILILRGLPTATTAIHRTRGFLAEIKKYPRIKISAILDGNYLRGETIKVMHKALNEGLQFDAIYAQSDSMASGARLALKKAGIKPADKHIVGIDYIKEARNAILNGEQAASFIYPTSVKQAGEIVVKILHNKKVPKKVSVPSELVTRQNVTQLQPIF